jgi:hypothetical protein
MRVAIAVLVFVMSGCASKPVLLTSEGSRVRIVKNSPTGCRYISGVEGRARENFVDGSRNVEGLNNDIKNEAARA